MLSELCVRRPVFDDGYQVPDTNEEAQLLAQAFKTPGILEHDASGVGEQKLLSRAVDQLLAQLGFETLNSQRHGRLRAQ